MFRANSSWCGGKVFPPQYLADEAPASGQILSGARYRELMNANRCRWPPCKTIGNAFRGWRALRFGGVATMYLPWSTVKEEEAWPLVSTAHCS